MKKSFITIIAALTSSLAYSQDEKEVLTFSQYNPLSTARSIALGGAMGSIGADYGGISVNPATLAKYSKGELSISSGYSGNAIKSSYEGNTNNTNKDGIMLNNIGLVLAHRYKHGNGWRANNFSMGFNRVADFGTKYLYGSTSQKTSITDQFAANVNSVGGIKNLGASSMLSQMAYASYLIDTFTNSQGALVSYVPTPVLQSKTLTEKGGIHEMSFSLAHNRNDNILVGASVGIPIVNHSRTTIYSETDASNDVHNNFDKFSYTENLNTSGAGINLKAGVIWMPNKILRLGAAFHSPTAFQMTESGNTTMQAHLEQFMPSTKKLDYARAGFEYNIKTPARIILSGSALLGKYGFVSADFEHANYGKARIDYNSQDANDLAAEIAVNNVISTIGKSSNSLRIGGELRGKVLSARAGINMQGSATNVSDYINAARNIYSLGAGYRGNHFFFDVAYAYGAQQQRDQMYVLQNFTIPSATITNNRSYLTSSFGWKF